jgi:hypothetical protein
MSVLPQISYGNMALIFLSYFHGYNKNEIFTDYWDTIGAILFQNLPILPYNNVAVAMI